MYKNILPFHNAMEPFALHLGHFFAGAGKSFYLSRRKSK